MSSDIGNVYTVFSKPLAEVEPPQVVSHYPRLPSWTSEIAQVWPGITQVKPGQWDNVFINMSFLLDTFSSVPFYANANTVLYIIYFLIHFFVSY